MLEFFVIASLGRLLVKSRYNETQQSLTEKSTYSREYKTDWHYNYTKFPPGGATGMLSLGQ